MQCCGVTAAGVEDDHAIFVLTRANANLFFLGSSPERHNPCHNRWLMRCGVCVVLTDSRRPPRDQTAVDDGRGHRGIDGVFRYDCGAYTRTYRYASGVINQSNHITQSSTANLNSLSACFKSDVSIVADIIGLPRTFGRSAEPSFQANQKLRAP